MQVTAERKEFLRNTANKVQFIDFLINAFKREKINVIQSDGDADVMIVTEAIKLAAENTISVFSDDTDVLVLLMYHWSPFICDIYFSTERVVNKKKIQKQWNIQSVVECQSQVDHIQFAHAWSGCDTTSVIYGKGKLSI